MASEGAEARRAIATRPVTCSANGLTETDALSCGTFSLHGRVFTVYCRPASAELTQAESRCWEQLCKSSVGTVAVGNRHYLITHLGLPETPRRSSNSRHVNRRPTARPRW